MSGGVAYGLLLAIASTVALETGFLLQHAAASTLAPLSLRRVGASLRALLGARRWLLGFIVGIGGWAFYLAALRLAPLSLVQAVAAARIAVLVGLAVIVQRARPARQQLVGALVASGGLAAIAISLVGAAPARAAAAAPTSVIVGALVAGVLTAGLVARGRSAAAGGLAAGLLYGIGDVSSKLLLASGGRLDAAVLVTSPWAYATLAAHAAAFALLQRAFQRGDAISSIGAMTAAMNLLPIVAGVAILGDPLPASEAGVALRLAAFAASVAGAVLVGRARAAEPTASAATSESRPQLAPEPA